MSFVILTCFCRLIAQKKGGRQSCLTLFPGIDKAFLQIVDPHTAGDPDQEGVLWTGAIAPVPRVSALFPGFSPMTRLESATSGRGSLEC